MSERKALVDPATLSIRKQAKLLTIPRNSLCYKLVGESPQNLELMQLMARLFTEDPTLGVLSMQDKKNIR